MQNLNSLYYFYICAEQLSFSKAAKIIGITQPSLSMQIKSLEKQMGVALFLRNGKSVSLTSRGRELMKTAATYYELADGVKKCLERGRAKTEKSDMINILVSDEVDRPFVAEVVAKLVKKEKVKMAIYLASSTDLENMPETEGTNLLLTHERIDSSWSSVRIDFPVFFVTARTPDAPTFDDPNNIHKVMDYFGQDLIAPAREMKLGKEFYHFLKRQNLTGDVVLESNIISCLVRFVARGAGCSFLPLPYIKSSLEEHMHLVGPREGFWKHSIFIYGNLSKPELEAHALVKNIRRYSL